MTARGDGGRIDELPFLCPFHVAVTLTSVAFSPRSISSYPGMLYSALDESYPAGVSEPTAAL